MAKNDADIPFLDCITWLFIEQKCIKFVFNYTGFAHSQLPFIISRLVLDVPGKCRDHHGRTTSDVPLTCDAGRSPRHGNVHARRIIDTMAYQIADRRRQERGDRGGVGEAEQSAR